MGAFGILESQYDPTMMSWEGHYLGGSLIFPS